jgi:hypothetical protein
MLSHDAGRLSKWTWASTSLNIGFCELINGSRQHILLRSEFIMCLSKRSRFDLKAGGTHCWTRCTTYYCFCESTPTLRLEESLRICLPLDDDDGSYVSPLYCDNDRQPHWHTLPANAFLRRVITVATGTIFQKRVGYFKDALELSHTHDSHLSIVLVFQVVCHQCLPYSVTSCITTAASQLSQSSHPEHFEESTNEWRCHIDKYSGRFVDKFINRNSTSEPFRHYPDFGSNIGHGVISLHA